MPSGSSHLLRTAGPAICPTTVLLRIEFTASTCLHATGELLPHLSTIPHESHGKSISVALVRGLPLAGVTRYPCPAEPGLSSCTCFRKVPAVVRSAHDLAFIRNGFGFLIIQYRPILIGKELYYKCLSLSNVILWNCAFSSVFKQHPYKTVHTDVYLFPLFPGLGAVTDGRFFSISDNWRLNQLRNLI